ncbi:MAG: hypothetical protein WAV98_03275 [Minisyncoccia bacterium]
MQQEQIKTLLVNIFTGIVVTGVIVVGYFVFVKKNTVVIENIASVAVIAEETASIGVEIDATVRDLKDLSRAVASSKVIFDLPAFKNLQNFSIAVPTEAIGRTNPFVPTIWKLKMKTTEEVADKGVISQVGAQSALVTETQSETSANLIGGITGGI